MAGGGSYHIPDGEYYAFVCGQYFDQVFVKQKLEHLTEKQLDSDGPIMIDIDMRFAPTIKSRIYTSDHIDDLIATYLEVIREVYQVDELTKFPIFIFEKMRVNCVEDGEKSVTKDGIHMIIGIKADRITQMMIRERVLAKIGEVWSNLPLLESWDKVLDEGISKGCVNWQLYGSCKPHYEPYRLTHAYDVSLDPEDGQWMTPTVDPKLYENADNIHKLSARYREHPSLFMTSQFIKEYNVKKGLQDNHRKQTIAVSQMPLLNKFSHNNVALVTIQTAEELAAMVTQFKESISATESELLDTLNYTMLLSEEYYGEGSFSKWIRVGWALRNIDDRLFIVWIAFSSQSKTFRFSDIRDLYERWIKFDMNNPTGLTKRSIMHWAKQCNAAAFEKAMGESLDGTMDAILKRIAANKTGDKRSSVAGDVDLAMILFHLYKDEFVCVSIGNHLWYYYKNGRWEKNDRGTTLRSYISSKMLGIFMKKQEKLLAKIRIIIQQKEADAAEAADDDEENSEEKNLRSMIQIMFDIIKRLASTSDKNNIMVEAQELFFDGKFIDSLDTNPYLLCFTNGVVDFTEKVFRPSRPDDYLSICTNIQYVAMDKKRDAKTVAEINMFMSQIMPDKDLCEYLWQHLASILIGVAKVQTFNMYTGDGQNGKSVMVNLMEKVLGEYKCDAPLSIITQKRVGNGGVSPELAALRGCRYAVMAEPSKGDIINEGPMKQLTSGVDPIQCRALYSDPISFMPQFKLVVCSNALMEVKSNDHGTWRRIRVVPFDALFTDKPVNDDAMKPHQFLIDRNITEKFDQWKVVFMAMLVEIAFKQEGMVEDCDRVLEASNTYRQRQDYISAFMADKIVPTANALTPKRTLVNTFTEWYRSYYPGEKIPKLADVTAVVAKKYKINADGHWIGFSIRMDMITSVGTSEASTDDVLPEIEFQEE
jgi:P4 family phage/plasmid primase-like protien